MKFGSRFRNLLGINCMKLDSDLFTFDIFTARTQCRSTADKTSQV